MTKTAAHGDALELEQERSSEGAQDLSDAALIAQIEAATLLVQQDSRQAAGLLDSVIGRARAIGNDDLQAQAAYTKARAELNQGHLNAALDLIDDARALWAQSGAMLSAWRTDLGRMHVLDDLGRHRDAIAVGEELLAGIAGADLTGEDADLAAWLTAAAQENLGVGHGYLGDHSRALEAYAAAEDVYRRLDMVDDIPRAVANRGVELVEVGRYAEALAALHDAAQGFDEQGDRQFVAKCLAYQSTAHLMLGDYLDAALATQRAHGYLEDQEATTEYARVQLVRAETLSSLNLLDEALDLYDSLVAEFAEAGLRHDLADAERGRSAVLGRAGRTEDARSAAQRSAALYSEVGADVMAAAVMLLQSEHSDGDEARTLARQAYEVLKRSDRRADRGAALLAMARLATSAAEAQPYLDEVQSILAEQDIPRLRWQERHERGLRFLERGEIELAREALAAALDSIDEVRSTVRDEHERVMFMAGRSAVLTDLIGLYLSTGDVSAAYEMTEQARARTLVERMRGELQVKEIRLSSTELDDLYSQLLQAPSRRAAHLATTARGLERQIQHEAAKTWRTGEATAAAEFGQTAVVTYQRLGDEILAFVDADGSLTVVRNLATISEIADLVGQLDAQWRRFADPGLAARQHRHLLATAMDILQQLHLKLIAPLPGVLDADQLLIVPCEPLGNVPFAAAHDGTCHLIERLSVTVAPSRTVASHAAANRRATLGRRLAVGVGDEETPGVEREIRAVADASPATTVLLGEAATVDAFRKQAASHDVIHIACHGVDRPDNPLFSALRLGDRWLTAAEIAGFELDGQVVVLSACSSGRQQGAGTADELVGLPRAFLAAGAGAVVVNLWAADDASAAELMSSFHDHLGNLPPAEALRRAQVGLLSSHPHPYHWAPAIVFGAPEEKEST